MNNSFCISTNRYFSVHFMLCITISDYGWPESKLSYSELFYCYLCYYGVSSISMPRLKYIQTFCWKCYISTQKCCAERCCNKFLYLFNLLIPLSMYITYNSVALLCVKFNMYRFIILSVPLDRRERWSVIWRLEC